MATPVRMVGAIVIWQRSTDKIVEVATAALEVDFPYIPGLLTFRELPALLAAWRKLRRAPDAVICDGQGIAYMRGLGIASHFGLYIDVPTIGCGKSRLVGSYVQPGTQKGSVEMLTYKGVEVGAVVRTRANISSLFITPGNQCDIEGAVALTLRTTGKYRLPEPIRAAHKSCGEMLSELTLSKRDIL